MLISPLPEQIKEAARWNRTGKITYVDYVNEDDGMAYHQWVVNGKNSQYNVFFFLKTREWNCSCDDFTYRGEENPRYLCKHLVAVIAWTVNSVGSEPKTQTRFKGRFA